MAGETMREDAIQEDGNDDDSVQPKARVKRGIKLPAEIDLRSEHNRPRKDQPSSIVRFLRVLGLWIFTFSLIVSFGYSIFIASTAFNDPSLAQFKEILSYSISFVSLGGFLLIAIASESKDRATEIERILQERKQRMIDLGLTEDQARLVEAEFMPVRTKRGKKAKLCFYIMACFCLSIYTVLRFAFGQVYNAFAMYGLVGATISVGFSLSGFAGELNVEVFRLEIWHLHIHEAAIGIFFIIVSVPLLYNGASTDKILALFYFFIGAFLIGRDWKDVSAGKIIEYKKKPDQDSLAV
jgi:hypothetical protein